VVDQFEGERCQELSRLQAPKDGPYEDRGGGLQVAITVNSLTTFAARVNQSPITAMAISPSLQRLISQVDCHHVLSLSLG
jgi:hypothetical protein